MLQFSFYDSECKLKFLCLKITFTLGQLMVKSYTSTKEKFKHWQNSGKTRAVRIVSYTHFGP